MTCLSKHNCYVQSCLESLNDPELWIWACFRSSPGSSAIVSETLTTCAHFEGPWALVLSNWNVWSRMAAHLRSSGSERCRAFAWCATEARYRRTKQNTQCALFWLEDSGVILRVLRGALCGDKRTLRPRHNNNEEPASLSVSPCLYLLSRAVLHLSGPHCIPEPNRLWTSQLKMWMCPSERVTSIALGI